MAFDKYLTLLKTGDVLRQNKNSKLFCTFCFEPDCDCGEPKEPYKVVYDQYLFWLDMAKGLALESGVPTDSGVLPKLTVGSKQPVEYTHKISLDLPISILLPNGNLIDQSGELIKTGRSKFKMPVYGHFHKKFWGLIGYVNGDWVSVKGLPDPNDSIKGFESLIDGVWHLPKTGDFLAGLYKS